MAKSGKETAKCLNKMSHEEGRITFDVDSKLCRKKWQPFIYCLRKWKLADVGKGQM